MIFQNRSCKEKRTMSANLRSRCSYAFLFLLLMIMTPFAQAQYWTTYDQDTRYMALGDSLTAGYAAHPATRGFVYQLYQGNAIDDLNHTIFCNAGVPGALSEDVLNHQVPQVKRFFKNTGQPYRKVITLTVGGNDMLQILDGMSPNIVLATFGGNLAAILGSLSAQFPDVKIYVANQYDPLLPYSNEAILIAAINQVIAGVVQMFPNAVLVDIFSAFDGQRGLLLMERRESGMQIHPTDAGYGVMANAFADAIHATR